MLNDRPRKYVMANNLGFVSDENCANAISVFGVKIG